MITEQQRKEAISELKRGASPFYFVKQLQEDKELAKLSVSCVGAYLEYFPKFHDDEDVVQAAMESDPHALGLASKRIKEMPSFWEVLLKKDGLALMNAPEVIRQKVKLSRIALVQDVEASEYVPLDCRSHLVIDGLEKNKDYTKSGLLILDSLSLVHILSYFNKRDWYNFNATSGIVNMSVQVTRNRASSMEANACTSQGCCLVS